MRPHLPACVFACLAFGSFASQALAADGPQGLNDWQWSAGIKAWVNQWDSWDINRVQIGGSALQIVESISSGQTVAFVPVVSARRGDWSFTASAMSRARYTLENSVTRMEGSRSEADMNVGWTCMPGLALTAGYKQLVQNAGGRFVWRGPVLGATATARLSGGWALYGNLGLGRMSLKLPNADSDGQTSLDAAYAVNEVGLAYSFQSAWPGKQGGLTLAVGYRSQSVRTKGYALSSQPALGGGQASTYAHDDLRDATQGLALSLLASF